MSETPLPPDSTDPFSPENVGALNAIINMRIYDALIALLREQNPEAASDLLKMHYEGTIVGPEPRLNGQFLTDEMNTGESDEQ